MMTKHSQEVNNFFYFRGSSANRNGSRSEAVHIGMLTSGSLQSQVVRCDLAGATLLPATQYESGWTLLFCQITEQPVLLEQAEERLHGIQDTS